MKNMMNPIEKACASDHFMNESILWFPISFLSHSYSNIMTDRINYVRLDVNKTADSNKKNGH